jgi:predicted secreted protein
VPPLPIYPHFPTALPAGVGTNDVAEFYVLVNETGTVESVHALRVPATMAEAMTMTMSLSAAKAWRFRPGMKNGVPVKYRTIVWVLKN